MVTGSLCRVASRAVLANVYRRFYLGQLDGYANISKGYSHGFYNLIISSAHILNLGPHFHIYDKIFDSPHALCLFYKRFLHKDSASVTYLA